MSQKSSLPQAAKSVSQVLTSDTRIPIPVPVYARWERRKRQHPGPSCHRHRVGGSTAWVIFVISKRAVTFGELALLFKDRLGIANALYLDGTVSGVYTTKTLPKRFFLPIGPMVGAYPRP
jgi:hypothetical protein